MISPGSALGTALLGKKAGDTVQYETPTGATLVVEVADIS